MHYQLNSSLVNLQKRIRKKSGHHTIKRVVDANFSIYYYYYYYYYFTKTKLNIHSE